MPNFARIVVLSQIGAVVKMRSTNEDEAGTSGEHEQKSGAGPKKVSIASYWATILGIVAIGILYALLPSRISLGPRWLLLVIEGVLLLPIVIAMLTKRRVSPVTIRVGSMILLGIVTFALAVDVVRLLFTLPGNLKGISLLYSGLLLYCFNILVFALWYWGIDGGGPEKRQQSDHQLADFMFPQQVGGNDGNWAPQFFDYLSVAFTGATAFSPTDTMPLSHRAKLLMMLEAMLALLLISFVVSRAINIL
jgi:hypothetical protein